MPCSHYQAGFTCAHKNSAKFKKRILPSLLLEKTFTLSYLYPFAPFHCKLKVVLNTLNSVLRLIWLAIACCSGSRVRINASVSTSPSVKKSYRCAKLASTIKGLLKPCPTAVRRWRAMPWRTRYSSTALARRSESS